MTSLTVCPPQTCRRWQELLSPHWLTLLLLLLLLLSLLLFLLLILLLLLLLLLVLLQEQWSRWRIFCAPARSGYFDQASLNIVQTKIDMLVLFSQPRGILVDNLTMTSDLADTLIRELGVR